MRAVRALGSEGRSSPNVSSSCQRTVEPLDYNVNGAGLLFYVASLTDSEHMFNIYYWPPKRFLLDRMATTRSATQRPARISKTMQFAACDNSSCWPHRPAHTISPSTMATSVVAISRVRRQKRRDVQGTAVSVPKIGSGQLPGARSPLPAICHANNQLLRPAVKVCAWIQIDIFA
jgi:hypothetical protein